MSEYSQIHDSIRGAIERIESGPRMPGEQTRELYVMGNRLQVAVSEKIERRKDPRGDRRAPRSPEIGPFVIQGIERRVEQRRICCERRSAFPASGTRNHLRRRNPQRRKIPDRRAPRPPNS